MSNACSAKTTAQSILRGQFLRPRHDQDLIDAIAVHVDDLKTVVEPFHDIAVGTKRRLIWRICSPKPGISLSATASVASGVTSRLAGPVPPVVSTSGQRSTSTSSRSAALMPACSSGISRVTNSIGFHSARSSHSRSAGRPLSS